VVYKYLAEVKEKMMREIPIESGEFQNGKKWTIVKIAPMLSFLISNVPKYQLLTSPVTF